PMPIFIASLHDALPILSDARRRAEIYPTSRYVRWSWKRCADRTRAATCPPAPAWKQAANVRVTFSSFFFTNAITKTVDGEDDIVTELASQLMNVNRYRIAFNFAVTAVHQLLQLLARYGAA